MNIHNSTTLSNVFDSVVENDNAGELYIKLYPTAFLTGGPATTTDSTGKHIRLTEADILPGSFTIDRYTQSGEAFEIGTAYAAECKFSLNNYDKKFNKVLFEGAEILVFTQIDSTSYPLGRFTIDEKPRVLTNIAITALDDMVKMDRECMAGEFDNMKLHTAIMALLDTCHVPYNASDITNAIPQLLRNYNIVADYAEDSSMNNVLTYRQVLMWMLQLAFVNAYIDVEGKFKIRFYGNEHSSFNAKYHTINPDVRISADSLDERSYGVFKVSTGYWQVTQSGHTEPYVSDDVNYCLELDLSENPYAFFLETFYSGSSTLLDYIFAERFADFSYRPFKAKTLSFFWLEPMDLITYVNDDISVTSYIGHSVYKHGGFIDFEIKSESKTKSGYATANPATATERSIIQQIRTVSDEIYNISTRETNIVEFNKAINAGSALYNTVLNGITYYHDKPTLDESLYVMVANSAGVAWTDEGWNSSLALPNTHWKYGYTCDGNAILNSLDTYKLNAELITVNDLRAFGATIGGWHITQNSMYADVGSYRAYIQSASSEDVSNPGDSFIFSTQELTNNVYQATSYINAKGEIYAKNLYSKTYVLADTYIVAGTYVTAGTHVKTGAQTNQFESVIHNRIVNGISYDGKFGVGSLENNGTVALELLSGNNTLARFDVFDNNYAAGVITLKTSRKDPNEFNRYISFDSTGVYFHKNYAAPTSSTLDNIYCEKMTANGQLKGKVNVLGRNVDLWDLLQYICNNKLGMTTIPI